ncbi:aldehyde dehydrogenase family protein [Spiribacter sp. C176]|uniref:Aldehyde dehydrogenase family protein n=1 Tax=Spiribacter salilacus TaxID=2664894 RepID=A0A6N7QS58_9GAMM|nr:aldehyde dehydrogenase family protein [Spiribacter salilacus]MRH77157.1 aldehyde dehydrogenase family protein [Spiribacter salilacus]
MYGNHIAGHWVDGTSININVNPSDTRDVIGEYAIASAEQTQDAIAAAKAAQKGWQSFTAEARSDILDEIGNTILARREELGTLLSREEGKTLAEGIGEVVRAGRVFKFFAGEALRLAGERLPSVRPGVEVEVTRHPLGSVGIITPWNFPIAIPAWKIAPALAYGNTVVFKPAGLVPGSAWALTDIITSATGMPPGVFNLVMGQGSVVGECLARSELIDAITFTGSTPVGRGIATLCAERGARVQLEMGGKNPLVVLNDADIDVAISIAVSGGLYSTGQRCTASSRLIVEQGVYDSFVSKLTEATAALEVGNALDPKTDIGPVVSADQLEQDLYYIKKGVEDGGKLEFGGEIIEGKTPGYYLKPAIFSGTSNEMTINRDEVFGPVMSVIEAADYEEALALANATAFGLSAGICTRSLAHAADFRRNAQAGMTMVNLPTAGVDYHAPFGGMKASSYGPREQGSHAREFFTITRTNYMAPGAV